MIGIDVLIGEISGLQRLDVERWIDNDWVRPGGQPGAYAFHEVDVARVRLIRELRDELLIDEEALPVVLMLLNRLYDLRRRLHELGVAIDQSSTQDMRPALVRLLARTGPP